MFYDTRSQEQASKQNHHLKDAQIEGALRAPTCPVRSAVRQEQRSALHLSALPHIGCSAPAWANLHTSK